MEPDRERCHRPSAFDKMEGLVREMQDADNGVPVRSQKIFLTSIPSAFMGYDLIEWLMDRLSIEESEALNIANQLCQYGYFFPVSDSKNLVVKDDSSLYRFQSPYYWPWQNRPPDQVEYAIYLAKRTLRNKQRHGLEDYELEALGNLRKNLANKWDFITMQAEEQVKLAKVLKKGDKIVSDSQERAYWRVHRPPPGIVSSLEQCPVPTRCRNGNRTRKRTIEDGKREVELLKNSLSRTRVKVSQALESMVQYVETYSEYDPLIAGTQPSNPWVSEDLTFWQLNGPLVEAPTEKRVKRWGLTIEELVADPTGLQEFTAYLRKEYSHENIRFWTAVNDLRRSAASQIQRKVNEIFEEFLAPGAPCEINIDGKTMERVHQEMKTPSRFTFDCAQEHVYTLLLKKDCYPRFIRSEHYKNLLATGIQPSAKKRFFGFGPPKKKTSTSSAPNPSALLQQQATQGSGGGGGGGGSTALTKRRGSDRSLSGSAHELAVSGVNRDNRVPHSHSQSNLSDIPYRVKKPSIAVTAGASTSEDVCPWESGPRSRKNSTALDSNSSSSDISVAVQDVAERLKKSQLTQQNTLDGGKSSRKLSTATCLEPRRASVSVPLDRRTMCAFEEVAAASASPPQQPVASDADNKRDDEPSSSKTFKKSLSVASSNAPTISVSSVADDSDPPPPAAAGTSGRGPAPATPVLALSLEETESELESAADEVEHEESTLDESTCKEIIVVHPPDIPAADNIGKPDVVKTEEVQPCSSRSLPVGSSGNQLVALAPLAEPDSESPISEHPPEIYCYGTGMEIDDTIDDPPADISGASTSTPPKTTTTVEEEKEAKNTKTNTKPSSGASGGSDGPSQQPSAQTSTGEDEARANDVCPWEDEETQCNDGSFKKTYTTLGFL